MERNASAVVCRYCQHHEVVVIETTGQRVGQLRVAHSAVGIAQLITWLRQIGDIATCPEPRACIIAVTQGVLITALFEQGVSVYPVNPKTVAQARKPSGATTDAIDAWILARIGRSDFAEVRRLQPDPPLIQHLKTLTREQDTLLQAQTRLTNQLIACLKAYYPLALTWCYRVASDSMLTFLEPFPSVPGRDRSRTRRRPQGSESHAESRAPLDARADAAVPGRTHDHASEKALHARPGGATASGDGATGGR
jgi:hypothetical protein